MGGNMTKKRRIIHKPKADINLAKLDRDIERASIARANAESEATITRLSAKYAPKKAPI
jgi:hypothetical protein